MSGWRLTSLLLLSACAPAVVAPPPPPPPPPREVVAPPQRRPPIVAAAKHPIAHTYFNTTVTDDYQWLEDPQSPETKAFIDAENQLARAKLDALPERAAVKTRIASLYSATAPDWFNVTAEGGKMFALKDAPPKQARMLVEIGSPSTIDLTKERVVVDPNAIDASGKTSIDWFYPSPDAKTLAVSLSSGGSESGDVHLFDVATGKDKGETTSHVNGGTAGGSLAWNSDGTGFWYTRYPHKGEKPDADRDFFQQVYFHKIGTPESADTYAIGKDFPRIAEVDFVRSDDGKRIVAKVENGDGGEYEHHVFDGGKWIRISKFEDELSAVEFGPDGRLYAVSRKGAPKGKVVAFAPPFDKPATDVLPESETVISDLIVAKDAIYTVEIADGPSAMRRFPIASKAEPLAFEPKRGKAQTIPAKVEPGSRGPILAVLPLPPLSAVTSAVKVGNDLLVRLESYTTPPRWMFYRTNEHRFVATDLVKKPSYDMNDVEGIRETCTSKDGTKVPMTILRKKGATGLQPAFLTGYGGFGVTIRPRMRATYRVWLDAGGVVVETNLRGGGERGEAWHKAGSLLNKQNVFDDFAACAKTLIDLKYTSADKLAISGRSNGGLLMGAELTQHSELFRAVAAGVGIYDMLRTELSPNGAFNVTEYGTVKNEAQFNALLAYSPFHHVTTDAAYPAILFMTAANDPRVDPYHSRKMAARLQDATSSERPILLRTAMDGGHGLSNPIAVEIEETSDMLSFLMHEVGAHL
jgi:prolyl oligopeptidase